MSLASSTKKPSLAQAQVVIRNFWGSVDSGKFSSDQLVPTLHENPWLIFERSPKGLGQYKNEPFLNACIHYNQKELFDFGLNNGAPLEDRDGSGHTALYCLVFSNRTAWESSKWSDVDRLIKAGARCEAVDNQGIPLWIAMGVDGPAEWLDRFVAGGSPVNSIDLNGMSGLSKMIDRSFNTPNAMASAKSLVMHGADVNLFLPHQMEFSPVARSFLNGSTDMANFLLEHGADLFKKDALDRNFLHFSINAPMVKWLYGKGVDLEARDRLGRTPLLTLVFDQLGDQIWSAKQEAITAMIVAGADLNARDYQSTSLSAGDLIRKNQKKFPNLVGLMSAIQARAAAHQTLDEIAGLSP